MENLNFLSPVSIYESIIDGSLVDYFDKRLVSGLITYFGLKLAYKYIMRPGYILYKYYLRPSKDLYKRYEGGWAVVTGASDGLGLGFSKNLAKLGFNVLMISKDLSKLNKKAKEVRSVNGNIKVEVLEFNFNRPYNANDYLVIYKKLDELDVSLLVNNVGYVYAWKDMTKYHEYEDDHVLGMYQLNVIPMIHMTKYFLGRALKREGKKSGIVNVSSLAANLPIPGNQLYSGSKAFIDNFTKSLAATPLYKDIDFLCLNACSVTSNMNQGKIMLTVEPDDYAKQALRCLGNDQQDPGHFYHYIYTKLSFNPLTCIIVYIDIMRKIDSIGSSTLQKPVNA